MKHILTTGLCGLLKCLTQKLKRKWYRLSKKRETEDGKRILCS
jgi:hypothetical protein